MARAYLGLGSNLGPRTEHIRFAVRELARIGVVLARSPLLETQPVDCPGGGLFRNACVSFESSLEPRELLNAILAIETARDRQRHVRNAPRTLDIDLLLYGNRIIRQPGLAVPHPRMHERSFVLDPLVTIAPQAVHPVLQLSVSEMRLRLGSL